MIWARRLNFQLTPLLDLLLIVIFVQYLEVATTAERDATQEQKQSDELTVQLAATRRQLADLEADLAVARAEADAAQVRARDVDQYRAQRDLLGEVIGPLFRLSPDQLQQLLTRSAAAGPATSPADIAALRQQLETLGQGSPQQIVDHLLTFGEMNKRIDLWQLYMDEAGLLHLTVSDQQFQFRSESTDDIVTRLFDAYKTLPEPKSTVLILLSYGDVKFRPLKAMLDGLPAAMDRIRLDVGNRTRFEYAILGFRSSNPTARLPSP